ncbi:MAG: glycosyltransferase [Bacillota bacterium]|nr:glycosyltransferase [Bacillota bacterium]
MKVSIIIPAYNVEMYIRDMLACVEKQTMGDFEAIIINDGSTDNTQQIVDSFCDRDCRFRSFYQENGGVSSARNLGLQKAKGKYIVFWDSDDYIPENSLMDLCNSIESQNADLVIGFEINEQFDQRTTPKSIRALCKQKYISKTDTRLIWGMSLWNKIYKREIIEKYGLFFKPLRLGEDTVFYLEYLGCCNKITGCDKNVYVYKKRFVLNGNPSLTQDRNRYYSKFITEYTGFLENAISKVINSCSFQSIDEKIYYRERLYHELNKRILRNIILNDMYRYIWQWSDNQIKTMFDEFEVFYNRLTVDEWNKEQNEANDLNLENGLKSREDLINNPRITFVITRRIGEQNLINIINALYQQRFPEFEILIDEAISTEVDKEFELEKLNRRIVRGKTIAEIKNNALQIAKGEFIQFIEEVVFPNENTYRGLFAGIKSSDNIMSLYLKYLNVDKIMEYPAIKTAFKFNSRKLSKDLDYLFSNKIFNCEFLRKNKVFFTNNPYADIKALCLKYGFRLKKKFVLYTTIENGEYIKGVSWLARIKRKVLLKIL